MSDLILDPNNLPVEPPSNAFWEKPVTRSSFQAMLNQIGKHITILYEAVDTANILINYIVEEHLMKDVDAQEFRKKVDEFVAKKQAALKVMRETALGQVGPTNEG